jgi:hypothetical protein
MTPDLIEHLESHLGPLEGGWRQTDSGDGGVRVVSFADQPYAGVRTYVTLGLSRRPLPMPRHREVRQEIVFVAGDRHPAEQAASFLLTFAEHVRGQKRALLRGDVVGPGPRLIPGVALNAVYAAIPVLHDESFATFSGSEPPTVFVWAVPLHAAEAKLVRRIGWEEFEDLLESRDPDLADLDRASLV